MDPPLPRQESSGALPKMADVQAADIDRYIKPLIREMYAKMRSAVKEHMMLVKSQYQTGLSRVSREAYWSTDMLGRRSDTPTPPHPRRDAQPRNMKQVSSHPPSQQPAAATAAAAAGRHRDNPWPHFCWTPISPASP
jgi:hypothetical protein